MTQPIATANENKIQVVNELNQLLQKQNWRALLKRFEGYHGAPDPMIDPSTLYRILKGQYDLEKMRDTTFQQLCWILEQVKNEIYSKQNYAQQLEQSLLKFPQALQRFLNPKPVSLKSIADQISGEYQGYRLSIAQLGYVIRLKLKISYNEEKNVLETVETVHNKKSKTGEVFEGCCAINLDHSGVYYFVTRINKASQISRLLFTVIYDHSSDSAGYVNLMKGVVFGHSSIRGPFARQVIYDRTTTPIKTDFISEADFVAEATRNKPILDALRQSIDAVI